MDEDNDNDNDQQAQNFDDEEDEDLGVEDESTETETSSDLSSSEGDTEDDQLPKFGPKPFILNKPRYREISEDTSKPKSNYVRLIPVTKIIHGKVTTFMKEAPSPDQPLSIEALIADVRDRLTWMHSEEFKQFFKSFKTIHSVIELKSKDSNAYTALLKRLRSLGHELNKLIEDGDNILDMIDAGHSTYSELSKASATAMISPSTFREMINELGLIADIAETIKKIHTTNDSFKKEHVQHCNPFPEQSIVPNLENIKAMYKSHIYIIEVCKNYALQILQELRMIRSQFKESPLFEFSDHSADLLNESETELNDIAEELNSIYDLNRPAIRPDRRKLIYGLAKLMEFIRKMCEIRRFIFNLHSNYLAKHPNTSKLTSEAAYKDTDMEGRWSGQFDWSHRAETALRDLPINLEIEKKVRQQQFGVFGTKTRDAEIPEQLFPQTGLIMNRKAISMLDIRIEDMYREIDALFQQIEQQQSRLRDSLESTPSPPSTQPQVQFDETQNWRTTPGGARGHSNAAATITKPRPDDDDVEDEKYGPSQAKKPKWETNE